MSQLIKLNVTNRGSNLDLVKGAPVVYGFDVDDIASPIRRNTGLSKSYFTAEGNSRTPSSMVKYLVTDTLASIKSQSIQLLLLTVTSRRGVIVNNEQYIFVASKISEDLVTITGGTKFYYTEQGDPLPVFYTVSETVAQIVLQTLPAAGSTDATSVQTITGASIVLPNIPVYLYFISKNGQILTPGVDYTIAGNTITLLTAAAADVFLIQYKY